MLKPTTNPHRGSSNPKIRIPGIRINRLHIASYYFRHFWGEVKKVLPVMIVTRTGKLSKQAEVDDGLE